MLITKSGPLQGTVSPNVSLLDKLLIYRVWYCSVLKEEVQIQLIDNKVVNKEMCICKAVAAIKHLKKKTHT